MRRPRPGRTAPAHRRSRCRPPADFRDCFVTPDLAAALGARAAEVLEQGTTVLVVDPQRPTRRDFVGALLRRGIEPWRAQFGDIGDGSTARREIVPGAGELHLFETSVGVPVFYEI